jgi:hypothetical protein
MYMYAGGLASSTLLSAGASMGELMGQLTALPNLLIALIVFGFGPTVIFRMAILIYPHRCDRARKLKKQYSQVPYLVRPFWVADHLAVILVEAVPIRLYILAKRLRGCRRRK